REGQPLNIRVEITINESGGTQPPVKKTVVTLVGDAHGGSVREVGMRDGTPLNVDVHPDILTNGKVRLSCTIQYQSNLTPPQPPGEQARPSQGKTDIRQNIVVVLDSGKPLTISEATDPITDRKVTVEVTATILK